MVAATSLALVACDGAAPAADSGLPGRDLWERCQVNEECDSTACVQVASSRGVCTRRCESDGDCPGGASWGCVSADGAATRICACVSDAEEEICGDGLDNDCNGATDDCRECGGVPVPVSSPEHCGECFRACRDDQLCADGECECSGFGFVECVGACVDPRTDASHCGACGNACPAAQECRDSACVCPRGTTTLCGDVCVDAETDPSHCGGCGVECPLGTTCRSGECVCTDARAPTLCPPSGCVDTDVDERHCGGCGAACERGEECVGGVCSCPVSGELWCDGACRDVANDVTHCGACATSCRPGERCLGGSCRCDSGLVCDGVCAPVDDSLNCGACGVACRADQRCVAGTCRCVGTIECGGRCADLATDVSNCGACGVACGTAMSCVASSCQCTGPLATFCSSVGGCVEPFTDPAHCGGCDRACAGPQVCRGGACACPTRGETYCPSLGRCVDLDNDSTSCGACGNACPAAQICVSGTCSCPASGESFCPGTGTCEDLSSDPAHCGGCGASCASTEVCRFGACACPAASERWCASTGVCTDVASNDLHCGGCDVACASGASCGGGVCRCGAATETLCADGCHDLDVDAANCGACGFACLPSQACRAGACACPAPVLLPETLLSAPGVRALDGAVARGGAGGGGAAVWTWAAVGSGVAHIVFQRLDAAGAKIGPELDLTAPGSSATEPAITWNGTEWGVVWRQARSLGGGASAYELVLERLDATGAPIAPRIVYDLVRPGFSGTGVPLANVQVVHSSTLGYVVVGGRSATYAIVLGDGTAPQDPVVMSGGFVDNSAAVAPTGAVGVVYQIASEVWFRQLSPAGALIDAQLQWSWTPSTIGFRGADPRLLHNGTRWVIVARETDGARDRVTACVLGSCATRSVLSDHAPLASSRQTAVASFAGVAVAGFHADPTVTGTRQLFGLRFDPMTLTPLEPLGPLGTSVTVAPSEWSIALLSAGSVVTSWTDVRGATDLRFARALDISGCP